MIDILNEAIDNESPIYHEFLLTYHKNKKYIYGFVEGKDDPSFYRNFIENTIPNDWNVVLLKAGNKDRVISLYNNFDWNRFSKLQILFFIDKDLSEFLNEYIPSDINIFLTEFYSIENYIITYQTFERILIEVYNINIFLENKKKILENLFNEQLNIFKKQLILIMSWIIYWKRNGLKPSLNDIKMKHLFKVENGKLILINKPKNYNSIDEYIHNQCNIHYNKNINLKTIKDEFISKNGFDKYIRGKYLFWFFIEFLNSINNSINKIINYNQTQKKKMQIGYKNAIILIAPRVRIPNSIRIFLQNNASKYINEYNNKIS